jgi:hypothetical protein
MSAEHSVKIVKGDSLIYDLTGLKWHDFYFLDPDIVIKSVMQLFLEVGCILNCSAV